MSHPRLVYCTTCMDRLEFLRGTFENNTNRIRDLDVEWVILDYGSKKQDIGGWLRNHKARRPELFRQVRAYRVPADKWHGSHAKNVAHSLSGPADVVCNLDCDTFITEGHPQFLMDNAGEGAFVSPEDQRMHGSIAMGKSDFLVLGGYDEDFRYYGYEDADIVERAARAGLRRTVWPYSFWVSIGHDLKTENTGLSQQDSMKTSWHILTRNRRRPIFGANPGRAWGFTIGVERIIF